MQLITNKSSILYILIIIYAAQIFLLAFLLNMEGESYLRNTFYRLRVKVKTIALDIAFINICKKEGLIPNVADSISPTEPLLSQYAF